MSILGILLLCLPTTLTADHSTYLSYTPYWGLSNQLQELNVAANWAKYLHRTLVLPTYAQSRSTPSGVEPLADNCHTDPTNCEMLTSLINVKKLREYVPVILEQEHEAILRQEDATDSLFVIDFGIDFSNKTMRTTYLVRWMEDTDRSLLHAYKRRERSSSEQWCAFGVQLGPHRCQRSAQELMDETSRTIHFPIFTTFTVGRIWAATTQQRDLLNKRSNHYVSPSVEVLRVARRVRRRLFGTSQYNSVHVRLGDFLTEEWAKSQVSLNATTSPEYYCY